MIELFKIPFYPSKINNASCYVGFFGDTRLVATSAGVLSAEKLYVKDLLSGNVIEYDWCLNLPANVILTPIAGYDNTFQVDENVLAVTTGARQTVLSPGCTGNITGLIVDPLITSANSHIVSTFLLRELSTNEPISTIKGILVTDVFIGEIPQTYTHTVNNYITTKTLTTFSEEFLLKYGTEVLDADMVEHVHNNKAILDATTASFTPSYANSIAASLDHIGKLTGNPHQVTKGDVGLELVPNVDFTTQVTSNTNHRLIVSGNPHQVTKAEVGLSNVPNVDFTLSITANNTHRMTTTGNPHQVTKAEVGLSNVPNIDFTEPVTLNTASRHSHTNKAILDATTAAFTSEQANAIIINTAKLSITPDQVAAITANTNHRLIVSGNPHQVTKAEVGLGNVPNVDFTSVISANTTHSNIIMGNPHQVTKADVGLGNTPNVDFTADVASSLAHISTITGNPHQVTKADIGLGNVPNVDCTNASNITTGMLPSSVLPPIAITDTYIVDSESAMLALSIQSGDIAIRTELNQAFINATGINVIDDWYPLASPTAAVLSVNGMTGTVVLTTTNVAEGTNLYYTEARVSANTDVAANTANRHTHANKTILDATTAAFTATQADRILASTDHVAIISGNPHQVTKAEVGLGNVPNIDFTAVITSNTAHTSIISGNPHQVTKAEVGLGLVPNHDFTAEVALNTAKVGITPEQATAIVANTAHASTVVGNPHNVTKADIGLGNVPNVDFTSNINASDAHIATVTGNPHQVTKAEVGLGNVPNIDCTNASNITTGMLPSSVIPPIGVTDVYVVADEIAMLALTVQSGDIAIRTDLSLAYINITSANGSMDDWYQLSSPTNLVLSVNGQTGTVVLTTTNVAEGTNLYYTEARVSANADVAANTANRHSHTNKVILDATTAAFTSEQANAIIINTAKVGITIDQANAIVANTNHRLIVSGNPHQVTKAEVGLGNVPNVDPFISPSFTGNISLNGSCRSIISALVNEDIDCTLSNFFTKTVDGNISFTFSNAPNSVAYGLTLVINHISGSISWPASVRWSNGLAPIFDAGNTHIFIFITNNGGNTWYGTARINYPA